MDGTKDGSGGMDGDGGGRKKNLAAVPRRVIASPSRSRGLWPGGRSTYRLVHTLAGNVACNNNDNHDSGALVTAAAGDATAAPAHHRGAADHGPSVTSAAAAAAAAANDGVDARETVVQIRSTDEECQPMSGRERRWEMVRGHFLRHRMPPRPAGLDQQSPAEQERRPPSRDVTMHEPIGAGEGRPNKKRGHKAVAFAAKEPQDDMEGGDARPHLETGQRLSPKYVTMSQLGLASTHGEMMSGDNLLPSRPAPQYTLQARRRIHHGSFWSRLTAAATDYSTSADAISTNAHDGCCNTRLLLCDPNRAITRFFHWTFRTSFSMLLLAFVSFFFLATGIFAGFILWAAADRPQCIASSAFSNWMRLKEGSTYGERVADAYALSWTTFSTVGYGLVYPQTSTEFSNQTRCGGLKFVCSVEAFLGVLFSGLCGAVLVAKVNRVQAHAQVLFSDPIVVRYGLGRFSAHEMDDASTVGGDDLSTDDGTGETSRRWPCPVLEFRIVNKLAHRYGGEIMDCTLHCSASIDAANCDQSVLNAVRPQMHGRRGKRNKRKSTREQADKKNAKKGHKRGSSLYMGEGLSLTPDTPPRPSSRKQIKSNNADRESAVESVASTSASDSEAAEEAAFLNPTLVETVKKEHLEVIEDSSNLVPRRIFSKLVVDPDTHPFFKRVWTVQIELNAECPLLSTDARKLLNENGGFWPDSLNNYQSIRNSIKFNNILISFSGTSNTNASTVFAHKVYSRNDLFVGFQFANILYRNDVGALMVDKALINDCLEQYGGGGEPLNVVGDDDE